MTDPQDTQHPPRDEKEIELMGAPPPKAKHFRIYRLHDDGSSEKLTVRDDDGQTARERVPVSEYRLTFFTSRFGPGTYRCRWYTARGHACGMSPAFELLAPPPQPKPAPEPPPQQPPPQQYGNPMHMMVNEIAGGDPNVARMLLMFEFFEERNQRRAQADRERAREEAQREREWREAQAQRDRDYYAQLLQIARPESPAPDVEQLAGAVADRLGVAYAADDDDAGDDDGNGWSGVASQLAPAASKVANAVAQRLGYSDDDDGDDDGEDDAEETEPEGDDDAADSDG